MTPEQILEKRDEYVGIIQKSSTLLADWFRLIRKIDGAASLKAALLQLCENDTSLPVKVVLNNLENELLKYGREEKAFSRELELPPNRC